MNILPLILGFILVFGGIALTFLRESKSFWLMESTLASVELTQRSISNRVAQRAYLAYKGEPLKKGPVRDRSKGANYQCRRALFPPLEEAKFNLSPLFAYEGPIQLHPLYETLAEYLRLLYQKNLFSAHGYGEKIEYQVLDALLAKGHTLKEVHSLDSLFPEDLKLQKVFYKMLKGTTQHDETRGYPALSDCFSLRNNEAPICISYAAPPILEALFDTETKEFILETEKKKWESEKKYAIITKEELQNFLLTNPQRASILSTIESYLSHSNRPTPRKIIRGKDARTGIIAQKNL